MIMWAAAGQGSLSAFWTKSPAYLPFTNRYHLCRYYLHGHPLIHPQYESHSHALTPHVLTHPTIAACRSKDVVKSGGEWISSIQLENAAMGHPKVLEAAVIGVSDEKWGERPLLVVVPHAGQQGSETLRSELLSYMAQHPSIARYAVPDDVAFVSEIPHTATGKVSKLSLRMMFKNYKPRRSKL
eukprot:GHUV01043153.1.p1 GENE.GHUV01043153.1~~GHUV01043153.1.p1  ORF type:complete len:184 (+),score=37.62 GHUV01043153.1:68-619(+)